MNEQIKLSRLVDGENITINITELEGTSDFVLVGNLPVYHHFKDKIDPELWNRLEMIRIWENHFIHGLEVESTLPPFNFGAFDVIDRVMEDLEYIRDFDRKMWCTELSLLQHVNDFALGLSRCENSQTAFLYMTYYMKIRQKVHGPSKS